MQEFINIASQSAGARYQSRSFREFNLESFADDVIKPFIKDLITELEKAFEIPAHLKGFSALDPLLIPRDVPSLETYGIESIESLAEFYGSNCVLPNDTHPPIVDSESIKYQFKVFKTFVLKQRLHYENKHSQLLLTAKNKLSVYKTELSTLDSKRKKLKLEKNIKESEKEVEILEKKQKYSFDKMLFAWMENAAAVRHPDMTRLLEIAALIPSSTAEVERSFSLMKLTSTRLRNRMNQETLRDCMRICKFYHELDETHYRKILEKWLKAEDTKSGRRRVASRLAVE